MCSLALENDGIRLTPDRSGRIEAKLSNLRPASAITLIISLYCALGFVVSGLSRSYAAMTVSPVARRSAAKSSSSSVSVMRTSIWDKSATRWKYSVPTLL